MLKLRDARGVKAAAGWAEAQGLSYDVAILALVGLSKAARYGVAATFLSGAGAR